ncbi:MAG TPA: AI-2E family transporter [Phenylobacterium sp.]
MLGVLLVLQLVDVLLLVFGAILVAVLLHALASPLQTRLHMPRTLALAVAVAAVALAAAGSAWVFGREAVDQLRALTEILPSAWRNLEARLTADPLGRVALGQLNGVAAPDDLLLRVAPRVTADLAAALAAALIVVFAGLYLSFHPHTYLQGALKLLPHSARGRASEVAEACNRSLRRWLLGQLLSMVLVGATTSLGLWLVGVPSPLGLGLLAGIGQFVPVIGPMAAAVPGLVIASTAGAETFAWAALVYFGASQLEANLITPLILRQMAQLPMAVTLFAVLAMGLLLGPLGVLFATPLAVVAYVAVRMLYVEDLLGEPAAAPD